MAPRLLHPSSSAPLPKRRSPCDKSDDGKISSCEKTVKLLHSSVKTNNDQLTAAKTMDNHSQETSNNNNSSSSSSSSRRSAPPPSSSSLSSPTTLSSKENRNLKQNTVSPSTAHTQSCSNNRRSGISLSKTVPQESEQHYLSSQNMPSEQGFDTAALNGPLTSSHVHHPMQDFPTMGYGSTMGSSPWSSSMMMNPYGYSPSSTTPMMGGGFMGYGGNYGYGYGFGGGGGHYGPLSSLNQFLFSFQSVIFSVGQAVQIVGMNTQQLHHLYEQIMAMFDQALATIHELQTLQDRENEKLSLEQMKRKRRLKAIRWSIMLGITFAGYNVIRQWFQRRRDYQRRRRLALLPHHYG